MLKLLQLSPLKLWTICADAWNRVENSNSKVPLRWRAARKRNKDRLEARLDFFEIGMTCPRFDDCRYFRYCCCKVCSCSSCALLTRELSLKTTGSLAPNKPQTKLKVDSRQLTSRDRDLHSLSCCRCCDGCWQCLSRRKFGIGTSGDLDLSKLDHSSNLSRSPGTGCCK